MSSTEVCCEIPHLPQSYKAFKKSAKIKNLVILSPINTFVLHSQPSCKQEIIQHNNITQMRQPSSRGSPRPRGYIHQFIFFLISLSKQSAYKNHGSLMAGFILPQGSTQRDTYNSTAPFRSLIISSQKKSLTAPLGI